MKAAIMQPYFCPYIGYFQLISSVDTFVVYDDIQYTKKGWFNRNRLILDGKEILFTIPLKNESDFLNVCERHLADDSIKARKKILTRIAHSYRRAPCFDRVMRRVEKIFLFEGKNLFEFIHHSLLELCSELGIDTKIVVSSTLKTLSDLRGQERVIATNKALGADTYINAIGGQALYKKEAFAAEGIDLYFIRSNPIVYTQFGNEHTPWLSIIDVMMFNDRPTLDRLLKDYELIEA